MSRNQNGRNGFTLVELLVVISILTVLIAILLPVFSSIRQKSRMTDSISNLRQCGISLAMYCNDYGGETTMPIGPVAASVLTGTPTNDLSDTWRSDSSSSFGPPMIGSYAYVRYTKLWMPGWLDFSSQTGWDEYLRRGNNPTIMASIFYANRVPVPFHGDNPSLSECASGKAIMPDRVIRLRLDGSVAVTHQRVTFGNGMITCLGWGSLFAEDHQ